MKFVYIISAFDNMTGESRGIVAAFTTKDKAEDFYYKKKDQQKEFSCEYVIEIIAVDVE